MKATVLEETTQENEKPVLYGIPTPPSLKDAYLFQKELGRGAQAKVYLALRLSDQQSVVIKQLNINSVKTWKEYDLFQREAQILESIQIPGVARFYDAIDCLEDDPPCSYIIQEYIEGSSLAKIIKAGHRFKVDEVIDIILQLLNILSQLHSMTPPVIHRDIKPSNIMITPEKEGYQVTLIDFGAVANPQVQSGGSTIAGTFGYMPPEQLMGHSEPASDIYALAAVAVELFTGKSPAELPQKDFRLIFEPDMAQTPPALVSTLRRMLEPATQDRLSSTMELIHLFEQFKGNCFFPESIPTRDIDKNRALNDRITEVESVGESGNMDIWQELSDVTPRRVPDAVMNYYREAFKEVGAAAGDRTNKEVRSAAGLRMNSKIFSIIITIITSICILFIQLYLHLHRIIFIGISATVFISAVLFVLYFKGHRQDNQLAKTIGLDLSCKANTSNYSRNDLYQLIKSGRKTIATITSVDYIPLADEMIRQENNIYLCGVPCFRIKYSFNISDDSREDVTPCDRIVTHEYIAHSAPEGHYEKGDPIPIIYQIEKSYFRDTVTSIPFPFPLTDSTLDEVIDQSRSDIKDNRISTDTNLRVETQYDYLTHICPILDALEHPSSTDEAEIKEELIQTIRFHAWQVGFANDQSPLEVLLSIGNRFMDSRDAELTEAFICALSKAMYYRDDVTRQSISKYILSHLKERENRAAILKGLFNCEVCNYPEELALYIMDLYKQPDTDTAIKSLIENQVCMPLRYLQTYLSDPVYIPLFPQLFGNWTPRLHKIEDRQLFLDNLKYLSDCQYPSKVYYSVFTKACLCFGFVENTFGEHISQKCRDEFMSLYHKMNSEDQNQIAANAFMHNVLDRLRHPSSPQL